MSKLILITGASRGIGAEMARSSDLVAHVRLLDVRRGKGRRRIRATGRFKGDADVQGAVGWQSVQQGLEDTGIEMDVIVTVHVVGCYAKLQQPLPLREAFSP